MKKITTIAILLCSHLCLLAQDEITFSLVAPDTINPSIPFQVVFTLEGSESKRFNPPNFQGFEVLSGPNKSTSYSFWNGKSSYTTSFTYWLQAKESGILSLLPATISTKDGQLESSSKTIIATEDFQPQNQAKSKSVFPEWDIFEDRPSLRDEPKEKRKNRTKKRKTYRI